MTEFCAVYFSTSRAIASLRDGPNKGKYGDKLNTQMVKMTKDFVPLGGWTLPKVLLAGSRT